jgi:hypothetical protein
MVENETIETVIGHARRSSARPGRSDQVKDEDVLAETRADMTATPRSPVLAFAETKKGSLV